MSKSNNIGSVSSLPSLPVLVFLLFLGLKLAEVGVVTTWSWWWVTSPLWIPIGLVFGLVFGIAALSIIIIIIALIFGMSLTEIRGKATKINKRKKSPIDKHLGKF